MFQSYEERFPFESKFLDGSEPKAQVERLKPSNQSGCRFIATPPGLKQFGSIARGFPIEELHLDFTAQPGPAQLNHFSCPGDISRLSFVRSVDLGEDYDAGTFDGLKNYASLSSIHLSLIPVDADWFDENIKIIRLSGDYTSIRSLLNDSRTQPLTELDILNFIGHMSDFPARPEACYLRMRGAKLSSLETIGQRFPKLKTLSLDCGPKPLNVAPLGDLKSLEELRIIGPKKLVSLEQLQLPSLKSCYLSATETSMFFDRHPTIDWFRIKNFKGEASQSMLNRGAARIGREFGIGAGFIPEALRG